MGLDEMGRQPAQQMRGGIINEGGLVSRFLLPRWSSGGVRARQTFPPLPPFRLPYADHGCLLPEQAFVGGVWEGNLLAPPVRLDCLQS